MENGEWRMDGYVLKRLKETEMNNKKIWKTITHQRQRQSQRQLTLEWKWRRSREWIPKLIEDVQRDHDENNTIQ